MKIKDKLWGIVLILLAVFLIVSNLVPGMPNIGVFRGLLTLLLLSMTISSIPKLEFFGMLMPLAIISIMFKREIADICSTNVNNIGSFTIICATFICSIGLNMLFSDTKRKIRKEKIKKSYTFYSDKVDDIIDGKGIFVDEDGNKQDNFYSAESTSEDGVINSSVTFGSTVKYIKSEDFKSAELECNFGNIKAYFDKAEIKVDVAIINIDVNFGNAELYLPKEWNVDVELSSTLGSIKEVGVCEKTGSKVVIKGDNNFSNLVIYYI